MQDTPLKKKSTQSPEHLAARAQALRQNLRKRKQQVQGRLTEPDPEQPPAVVNEPPQSS